MATTTLTRPQQGRVIAACAGLAQRFGWNANVVRLLFLSPACPGPQFVIYLVLWVLIPRRTERSLRSERRYAELTLIR